MKFKEGDILEYDGKYGCAAKKGATAIFKESYTYNLGGDIHHQVIVEWIRDGLDNDQMDGSYNSKYFTKIGEVSQQKEDRIFEENKKDMKITSKTLMVSFETEVKLGNNDAIELTLIHQAFITENSVDLDLSVDVSDVKFLGVEIETGFEAYGKFVKQLKELGIDLNKLIDEKETELINSGLEDKIKLMFKDKI